MSVLNREERAVIALSTGIDRLIVDRVAEAYDALLRDDIESYRQSMFNALAQQGLPIPTPPEERPTAVDRVKRMCVTTIARDRHWDYARAAKYLEQAASP